MQLQSLRRVGEKLGAVVGPILPWASSSLKGEVDPKSPNEIGEVPSRGREITYMCDSWA